MATPVQVDQALGQCLLESAYEACLAKMDMDVVTFVIALVKENRNGASLPTEMVANTSAGSPERG